MKSEKNKFYPVSIAFACNDENGNFTNSFMSIEVGEELLSLENNYWSPFSKAEKWQPRLDIVIDETLQQGSFGASRVKGHVKISRRKFPIVGYKGYWGNIIWDCVIVDLATAMEIVKYLHKLKCFGVESGATNWFDKWQSDEPFSFTDQEINDLKDGGYQRP